MAYSEVTPLICQVPLRELSCHALAFIASSTCTGSRYEQTGSLCILFSRAPGFGLTVWPSQFSLLLLTMSLRRIILLKWSLLHWAYPKALRMHLALPRLPVWDWNFNQFPFCILAISRMLRIALPLAEEHGQGNRVLPASRILAWICCY